MGIEKIKLQFFPKHDFLVGLNVESVMTFDMSNQDEYDGWNVKLGIGVVLFTVSILKKRKGA